MIKGSKICGISDLDTLNFITNHPYPPQFIGFICNYKKLFIVTPGIRLPGDSANDQSRVMTPNDAFKNKVSGIVMGRSLIKGNIKNNIQRLIDHLNK